MVEVQMKPMLAVATDSQADVAAADLALQIEAVFAACPHLCGFVVEDLSGLHGDAGPDDAEIRIVISELSFRTRFSRDESHVVFNLIVSVVAELAAAQPEVHALLRGRTFARTLQ